MATTPTDPDAIPAQAEEAVALLEAIVEDRGVLAELDPELHASFAEAAPLKDKARLTAP